MSAKQLPWEERTVVAVLLAAAGGLWWYAGVVAPSPPVMMSGLVLVVGMLVLAALVIGLRRVAADLIGPLFAYDLVRTARRNRHIPLRCLYASLLLGMLLLLYTSWFKVDLGNPKALFTPSALELAAVPRFSGSVFATFLGAQMAAVLLLTPAYTAGAIADEKERRSLEFLLVTALTDREIVLGILASRLANLGLLVLTGLPVLCLMQFLGGIEPGLVLAGFAATVMTMLSVGSLGMLLSVHATKSLWAFFGTYFLTFLCMAFSAAVGPGLASGTGVGGWGQAGGLWVYAAVNGVGAVICAALATVTLRPVARSEAEHAVWAAAPAARPTRRPVQDRSPERPRRRVTDPPMLWKELQVEQHLSPGFIVLIVGGAAVFAMLMVPAASGPGNQHAFRAWGSALTCFALLVVPFSAAGCLTRERERRTLDTLLITPLERDEILYAKWAGSLLATWWVWVVLEVAWGLAVLVGGIHFVALLILLVSWFVYAAFLGCLGLLFSTLCASTLRATLLTVLASLCIVAVSWTLSMDSDAYLSSNAAKHADQSLTRFITYGLVPPRTLAVLAFDYADLHEASNADVRANIRAGLAGVVCYAAATLGLWQLTRLSFHRRKGVRRSSGAPRR